MHSISSQTLIEHYHLHDSKTNRNFAAAALLSIVTGLALAIFAATTIYCHKMHLPFFHKSIRFLTIASCSTLPIAAILWIGLTYLGRAQAKKRKIIIQEFKREFSLLDAENRGEICLKKLFLPTHNKHYKRELLNQVIQAFPSKKTLAEDDPQLAIIKDLEAAKKKVSAPVSQERVGEPKMSLGKMK